MKIRPVGVDLFHVDGRADMTKPLVAFHNVADARKLLNPSQHMLAWYFNLNHCTVLPCPS